MLTGLECREWCEMLLQSFVCFSNHFPIVKSDTHLQAVRALKCYFSHLYLIPTTFPLSKVTHNCRQSRLCVHLHLPSVPRFGVKRKPLYINLVRDPLDRLISFYYFTRNGDDIRPTKERRRERTMEVCVFSRKTGVLSGQCC